MDTQANIVAADKERPKGSTGAARLMRLAIAPLLILCVLASVGLVLVTPDFYFNEARLAPLLALKWGYTLYYPADSGPVLNTIYGPLAYSAYFPALLSRTPVSAVLTGSVTAACYFFGPAAWLLFRKRRRTSESAFLFGLFWTLALATPALRYCAFNIHADAPMLCFGALACGFLAFPATSSRELWLSALFAALAVFAKQNFIFLLPALAGFVWITSGGRTALGYAGRVALTGLLLLALACALFPWKDLLFNLYVYPSRHGIGQHSLLPNGSPVRHILDSFLELWNYSRWILLGMAICFAVEFRGAKLSPASVRAWMTTNRWSAFMLVSLTAIPFCALFRAKVGGDMNHFGLHAYFGILGILSFSKHLSRIDVFEAPVSAILIVLAALAIPPAIAMTHHHPEASMTAQAYRYELAHPGEAYFPNHPLAALMVEGKLYHFEYGIVDRALGGAKISPSHFARHIPPGMRYLGGLLFAEVAPDGSTVYGPVLGYLPEYRVASSNPAFPGLTLRESARR